jgi:hypothetical protein
MVVSETSLSNELPEDSVVATPTVSPMDVDAVGDVVTVAGAGVSTV